MEVQVAALAAWPLDAFEKVELLSFLDIFQTQLNLLLLFLYYVLIEALLYGL